MNKFIIILLTTSLFLTSCRKDRLTTVSGTLIHPGSNEPIKDAKVTLACFKNCEFLDFDGNSCQLDETTTVYSDENGNFYVEIDCGASKIFVEKEGFVPHSYLVKKYKDNTIEIKMDTCRYGITCRD